MTITKSVVLAVGAFLLVDLLYVLWVANFNMGLIIQGVVAVAVVLFGVFLKKIPTAGRVAGASAAAVPLVFSAFLVLYGTADNSTYDEDVVVVLGAGIHGEQVAPTLASRLDKAIEYHNKNPRAMIVVSGGQGPEEKISEALAMERYLLARGVPQENIIKEDRSTSTRENLSYSKKILDDRFPQGFSTVLVTSDFHVYRSVQTAKKAGLPVRHLGAATPWYAVPSSYLREMLTVTKMWVVGT
ncbi:MAG: YdcF family protein [Micrococcales bacterium]|nr:YdcF family protein [Micrococcales bacterium]MCL2666326.1 YdcF family protein [Micrococcales bacterium]